MFLKELAMSVENINCNVGFTQVCSFLGLSLVLDELTSDSVHVSLALVGEGLASGLLGSVI